MRWTGREVKPWFDRTADMALVAAAVALFTYMLWGFGLKDWWATPLLAAALAVVLYGAVFPLMELAWEKAIAKRGKR